MVTVALAGSRIAGSPNGLVNSPRKLSLSSTMSSSKIVTNTSTESCVGVNVRGRTPPPVKSLPSAKG